MKNIQYVSRFYKWLFQIMFCILPIIYVVFWINAPSPIFSEVYGFSMSFVPDEILITQALTKGTKMLGFMVGLIPLSIHLFTLYFLIVLFKQFERNNIFAKINVHYIKRIGYTVLAGQLLNPLYQALISPVLTWHNPPGQRVVTITLSGTNLGLLLTSLLIILISWIMAEGYKLKEEQDYTV